MQQDAIVGTVPRTRGVSERGCRGNLLVYNNNALLPCAASQSISFPQSPPSVFSLLKREQSDSDAVRNDSGKIGKRAEKQRNVKRAVYIFM